LKNLKNLLCNVYADSFMPPLVCILIGHLTNFFGGDYFDVSIGVNLTIMLVITTL